MEDGKFICEIADFMIPKFCGECEKYAAHVHGGNAVVKKYDTWGDRIVVKGKFLAGPNEAEGRQHPETLVMFAKMNFIIFADKLDGCPEGSGCPEPE